jgi:hypothetical protein
MGIQIAPVDAFRVREPGQPAQHVYVVAEAHEDDRARHIGHGQSGLQVFDDE